MLVLICYNIQKQKNAGNLLSSGLVKHKTGRENANKGRGLEI